MSNRLADASSPYLLQHRDNPVDWYQWGEDAFAAARSADIPILLSVGYAACHWCHVMAHESFEDPATAAYMNTHFVNVKVDREERPDVDRIYMDALQAIAGHGGWPMTVFLTPQGEPFFAGTYYPKEPRGRHPSFLQVLESVSSAWQHDRNGLVEQGGRLTAAVRAGIPPSAPPPVAAAVTLALQTLSARYDPEWGGFGGAPKFPQAPVLELLLRLHAIQPETRNDTGPMLRRTLDAMRAGGIYDQIGGGFARYSVDDHWLIPHFEKMLYDNALLARLYLRAGQELMEPRYLATAVEILDYLAGEMRDPGGGFHSAEDADSEGVEGKYYVWRWDEFTTALGDRAPLLADIYGVTEAGNFNGENHLHLAMDPAAAAAKHGVAVAEVAEVKAAADALLKSIREARVRPGRDDKIVTAWNGLAIRAFAEAAAVLADHRYLEVARAAADFLLSHAVAGGRLARSWRQGRVSGPGFCEDYAATALGLFALFQASGEARWYHEAARLTEAMIDLFGGDTGFFSPPRDATGLIARPLDFIDNPTPAANSLATEALLTLAAYTGQHLSSIEAVATGAGKLLQQHPTAVAYLLAVLATEAAGIREIAVVGPDAARAPLERVVWESFRPDCVLAASAAADSSGIPLLAGRTQRNDPTAYVCRDFVCDLPVTDADALRRQLTAAGSQIHPESRPTRKLRHRE